MEQIRIKDKKERTAPCDTILSRCIRAYKRRPKISIAVTSVVLLSFGYLLLGSSKGLPKETLPPKESRSSDSTISSFA
ncbi:MAG: hypothetical protein LN590_07400 [Rickettsia endosymbiont of Glossina mortisans submortisans]|nr:hypothetical protein [Rickettsia endosymbiont of Glossina mortisans submortisans]